jgi:DNA-binding PadR family transcriptional regulator
MAKKEDLSKYLPLSETTFYTMVCLVVPMHGYMLMQKVRDISGGAVQLGAGTLYTIFSTLEKAAMIEMISDVDRRKTYQLTSKGKQVLAQQIHRIEIMAQIGHDVKHLLTNDQIQIWRDK